jgi:ribose 5-phosphate isomerase A
LTDWDRWKLNPKQDWTERAKKNAAVEAVKHVRDGFTIGLGSGSTAAYAIEEIARRIKREKLRVKGVPTSYQAFMLAVQHGIPTTTLEEQPTLDLTIDGADQIDPQLNLIKGMGGALAREKIVASASKTLVIIADENKKVKVLGENDQPVPIEALPFAASLVKRRIRGIGGTPVIREGKRKVGPVITDNGNIIIDAHFGPLHNPTSLEQKIRSIPGIIETGLFVQMTDMAYIGKHSGTEKLLRKETKILKGQP